MTIVNVSKGKFRLVSKKGRNLGTFNSRAAAEKRERQVKFFKHAKKKKKPSKGK